MALFWGLFIALVYKFFSIETLVMTIVAISLGFLTNISANIREIKEILERKQDLW